MNMLRKIVLLLLIVNGYSLFGLDFYWVGGSGSWTDINHWATTSGGSVKHIHTPNSTDNVIFDANSSTTFAMIDINVPVVNCHTLDVSGLSFSYSFTGICKEKLEYYQLRYENIQPVGVRNIPYR